jgi:uncharacterized protein YndB with AHSA1/START domain
MAPEVITASIYIDAPPEAVFPYFVNPQAITRWMGEYAELEPEQGGRFAVNVRGTPVRGTYLEVQPPDRVVISWGYAGAERHPPGASTVEIRLVAEGRGTRVVLHHRDLPPGEYGDHNLGWMHYLPRLAIAATGADPEPDPGMPGARVEAEGQGRPAPGPPACARAPGRGPSSRVPASGYGSADRTRTSTARRDS